MAADFIEANHYRRFIWPALALIAVHVIGTLGYLYIGGEKATVMDAFYMTFITVATIGYGEIIDLSGSPGGRVFTVFVALTGIGILTYLVSITAAFVLKGEMNQALRRRKMQKMIEALTQHYIVCGVGRVGSNVANELTLTARPFVLIDTSEQSLQAFQERYQQALCLQGDASEDEMLEKAGIKRAAGIFAVTSEDSKNLVITLSAKLLNPTIRVVARCHEVGHIEKIRKVGAEDIVSPDSIGSMRIVSSMIRPQVVSFLDELLRSDDKLRIEEIKIPTQFTDKTLAAIGLKNPQFILLAVRTHDDWQFNPADDFMLRAGNTLVVMATPEGRRLLEQKVGVA